MNFHFFSLLIHTRSTRVESKKRIKSQQSQLRSTPADTYIRTHTHTFTRIHLAYASVLEAVVLSISANKFKNRLKQGYDYGGS